MLRKIVILLTCLILVTAAWSTPVDKNWTIVLGKSVGPLQAKTNRQSLNKIFQPIEISDQPGPQRPMTEIWGLRPERRLVIRWTDANQTAIRSILTTGEFYRTADNIGVGTSLRQLEKLNGKPFQYQTPASGAQIVDWKGGKLAPSMGKVKLKLSWRTPAFEKLSAQDRATLNKPGQLMSDSPLSRDLNPPVEQLYMEF